MEDKLYQIKFKLSETGFMSTVRITTELRKMGHSVEEVDEIFKLLEDDKEIHKVEYTNRFVAPYKVKGLYYYNPNKKKRRPSKKKLAEKKDSVK